MQARAGKIEKWPPSVAKDREIHRVYKVLDAEICTIVKAKKVSMNSMQA